MFWIRLSSDVLSGHTYSFKLCSLEKYQCFLDVSQFRPSKQYKNSATSPFTVNFRNNTHHAFLYSKRQIHQYKLQTSD